MLHKIKTSIEKARNWVTNNGCLPSYFWPPTCPTQLASGKGYHTMGATETPGNRHVENLVDGLVQKEVRDLAQQNPYPSLSGQRSNSNMRELLRPPRA